MVPTLVLVRHGESFGNLTGDYSTSQHDRLTDKGWAQARAKAQEWSAPFDRIIVSPLVRTRQTARPTLERFGVKGHLWPDIAEACWQEPRHLPPSEPELPGVPVPFEAHEEPWFEGNRPVVSPPDSERWQDGLRRLTRAARNLEAEARARGGRRILVFSHGYAISKLVILLTGEGDINQVYDIHNTGRTTLTWDPAGRWNVEEFNRR